MRYFRKVIIFFLLFYFSLPTLFARDLTVHFLDIGQGDSALVVFPNGKTLLIDAGPGPEKDNSYADAGKDIIIPYLKRLKIKRLDTLLITHPHYDHFGGAFYLLKNFKVKEVIDPGFTAPSGRYEDLLKVILANKKIKYRNVKKGDELKFHSKVLTEVLSPPARDSYSSPNNISIVLKITYGKAAFLFTGDIEALVEERLVSDYGEDLGSEVLKVPHHGSSTSSTENFLTSIAPKIAVISCGYNNRFRHPHKKTLNMYKEKDVKVYRTDLDGHIVVTSDGKKLNITNSQAGVVIHGE